MIIIGIYIDRQLTDRLPLQNTLTKYGNVIKTRLGLNDGPGKPSVILLQLHGDNTEIQNLINSLQKLGNIEVREMRVGE